MASTGRRSLGEALRSARAASASGTPSASVNSGSRAATPRQGLRAPGPTGPDPVVRMDTLVTKPTYVSDAATSAEFHRDASVWQSTPVRASQQYEYADRLDYAFSYGVKLLRSHGFKPQTGYTFDGPNAV
ncbi:hypothetical protein CYMTET_48113 [Cymbomonas tetramitiformis]|uniref:Uncharacterized protein n=1 Tax=Cymbomonas tetramitiformis TaxID=36881 RepID=A0AAE0BUM4_9CHLO|nr:hypothetical protein CYMTET_48113 [Cymbomonas tetramitiformis]